MSCSKLQKVSHSPSYEPPVLVKCYFDKDIPNEILEMILARVPFENLLRDVPLVCKRWHSVHNKVCEQKRRLVLYRMLEHDRAQDDIFFQWTSPDLQFCPSTTLISFHPLTHWGSEPNRQFFVDKFPNISSIIIIQNHIAHHDEYDALFPLLRLHQTKLIELKWFLYHVPNTPNDIWTNIATILNEATNLRHLALYAGGGNALPDITDPVIVGRLSSFYVGGYEMDLTRLSQTRKLSITNTEHDTLTAQLQAITPQVAGQLTELSIYPKTDRLNESYTHLLTGQFNSLKYLYIRTKIPLALLVPHFAPLPKLKHLRLWHQLEGDKVSDVEAQELAKLPQLASVESLHLFVRFLKHDQLDWVNVVFPNLKWIKFDRFKSNCRSCKVTDKAQLKQCEQALFRPLKKCPQLKMIYFQRYSFRTRKDLDDMTSITYEEMKPGKL